jgi:hypothetical protein
MSGVFSRGNDKTAYVFQDGALVFIEMDYQEEVYLNGIDIFSVKMSRNY